MTSAVIQNNQPEARPFVYDDIDQNSNQIRLLRILRPDATSEVQLELFHTNLDDNPTYKALSYTWGSPADPRYGINLNGCHFEVRENLWHALRRFQAGNVAPVIWIDAICISQSSDNERNHQVAKMKRIYEQATEVVVWLGPSYEDSDLAIKLAKELYDHRESVRWVTQRFSMPRHQASIASAWEFVVPRVLVEDLDSSGDHCGPKDCLPLWRPVH